MSQSDLTVECQEDCGNAPKKLLLKDFTIALAKKDIHFCINCIHDEIVWEIVGKKHIKGIKEYEQTLNQLKESSITHLLIHNIITHGNTASLNGTFILKNKDRIDFCDVYNFAGFGKKAKIKKITSYVIKTS
ncbi:hypothetical protein OEV82_13905 [Caldibacillus thermolactis]|jgi:hypothetical protein|uniref:Nuclear transport factor 2 family protein n=1 Tax=Pallidibacillus thermolactis TaxID=251051 RepID=A0ABT2WIM5_9BACI|nr:nuclear transport factor 2 family protein [Pallidibacillus thermolactis]MCU9595534.1 hypothetical protein [Pallidibacillus thermolactis]MCU9601808.1 hypothetical protein [Pallidibacillus thermolactis subsp. kokeshiiformis]MED1674523.1 hypothetical protein [Pallidibacillus thermolactis subsp. kokeshiiformis]